MSCIHGAEWFEQFDQSDIGLAVQLHQWDRVVGLAGVDGELMRPRVVAPERPLADANGQTERP